LESLKGGNLKEGTDANYLTPQPSPCFTPFLTNYLKSFKDFPALKTIEVDESKDHKDNSRLSSIRSEKSMEIHVRKDLR